MKLIGPWGNPLDIENNALLGANVALRQKGTCAFCGYKAPITTHNPTGLMSVCPKTPGLSEEEANCVAFCAICQNFNSLDRLYNNGDPLGYFVEAPSFSQGEFINIQRILYCVAMSQNTEIKAHPLYLGSSAILKNLLTTPPEWEEKNLDGSVKTIRDVVKGYTGYATEIAGKPLYIDRLRFAFFPQKFQSYLEFWSTQVESHLMGG